jgi:hypothetical protein
VIAHPPVSHKTWYSWPGLWSLFLICALPIHLWALLLAVKDFSWVAERTNTWDAIGVLSYGMVFAFVESLAVALAAALLGFLISRQWWDQDRRVALLGLLVVITALWAIAGQLYFVWDISFPAPFLKFLYATGHPVRILYAAGLVLVAPTVLVPTYLVLRSDRFYRLVQDLAGRLGLLSGLYLLLDAVCLVILVIRNL